MASKKYNTSIWGRAVAAAVVIVSLVMPVGFSANAAGDPQPRDNNNNSILWGGAYSKTEWANKVHNGDGHNSAANIQHIYYNENRGITEANFMSSATVDGTVYKDGRVVVNGKTVATNGVSVGRNNFAGTHPSGSVWESSNQTSFLSDSIPAWVNMDGGVFHYVVIKACGNPGTGSAVPAPPAPIVPKPTPTTPVTGPSQSFACVELMPSQPDTANKPSTYRFTIQSSVQNVSVIGYKFNFGDNTPSVSTPTSVNYAEHSFGPGTWKVTGQVMTSGGTTPVNDTCSTSITVAQAVTPTSAGSVQGANTLVKTGPEAALGGVAGLSAIGYASRAYLRSRKSLLLRMRSSR